MRKYRTPGVYFERQDTAQPLIGPLRTDIAGFVGIAERGPLHTAAKIESYAQFTSVFGRKTAQAYLAYAVDGFFKNGGQTCWIVRVADPKTARTASLDIVNDEGDRVLSLVAGSPGVWANSIIARWMLLGDEMLSLTLHYPDGTEQQVRDPIGFNLPKSENVFELDQDALPASLIAPTVRLERPDRVSPSDNSVSIRALQGNFSGGADGLKTLTPQLIVGDDEKPENRGGLAALERISEVSIVAIPDIMPKLRVQPKFKPPPLDCTNPDVVEKPVPIPPVELEFPPAFTPDDMEFLQQEVINHCRRMQYRVAVLDVPDFLKEPPNSPPNPTLPEEAIDWRNRLRQADTGGSNFAALYYPWLMVEDPLQLSGLVRVIPPSGHVAGIYARSDRARGVHKPPANELVEGAFDVRFAVTDILHAELNEQSVNVIRSFAGHGIRIYGARTLNSEMRFINVRRLLSMIEKAIDQGTQWTVFEPNDTLLRRQMDREVRSYLQSLFRRGMLDGGTPEEAYLVKCDGTNNPPEEIERGRVICEVGVQPPYPAEFVVVVIGKTQDGLEVLQETGGNQFG
jgi:phage tail sheath protein FI